ncbi:MAG: DUF1566 domain-containing protein [Deltaproteobacteria bacterium]|nr:DUF1566 domain-containing protein [Deltaproteobacteria bacterium]
MVLAALAASAALAKAPAGRFTVKSGAGGDVVEDALMKRSWQRATAPGTYKWQSAKAYCSGLSLQGGGWRLPDVRELQSLVDFKEPGPTIDKSAFPDTEASDYWSTTAYQPSPSSGAWVVGFYDGYSNKHGIASSYRVRCVR